MIDLKQYPFQTARVIDGKTYIEVSELNELLDNLKALGPAFQQVADAAEKVRNVFKDSKQKTDNLLLELDKADQDLKRTQGML